MICFIWNYSIWPVVSLMDICRISNGKRINIATKKNSTPFCKNNIYEVKWCSFFVAVKSEKQNVVFETFIISFTVLFFSSVFKTSELFLPTIEFIVLFYIWRFWSIIHIEDFFGYVSTRFEIVFSIKINVLAAISIIT